MNSDLATPVARSAPGRRSSLSATANKPKTRPPRLWFSKIPKRARWAAGELGARVDLAAARTLRGDLAGAENALEEVFKLEPEGRTETVARRLTNLGDVLGASRYRNAVEASRISEAIDDFTARSLRRDLTLAVVNSEG